MPATPGPVSITSRVCSCVCLFAQEACLFLGVPRRDALPALEAAAAAGAGDATRALAAVAAVAPGGRGGAGLEHLAAFLRQVCAASAASPPHPTPRAALTARRRVQFRVFASMSGAATRELAQRASLLPVRAGVTGAWGRRAPRAACAAARCVCARVGAPRNLPAAARVRAVVAEGAPCEVVCVVMSGSLDIHPRGGAGGGEGTFSRAAPPPSGAASASGGAAPTVVPPAEASGGDGGGAALGQSPVGHLTVGDLFGTTRPPSPPSHTRA